MGCSKKNRVKLDWDAVRRTGLNEIGMQQEEVCWMDAAAPANVDILIRVLCSVWAHSVCYTLYTATVRELTIFRIYLRINVLSFCLISTILSEHKNQTN